MHVFKHDLIRTLYEIGAIKEGEYILKSGNQSPIYIDMRRIISFPDIYQYVVDLLAKEIDGLESDHIGAVPLAGLPLVSGISILYQRSMIMPRKEKKMHGTAQAIEGVYKNGETVILIDDVITSGSTVLQLIEELKKEGLRVKDVVVFIDREQGARKRLEKKGITLRSVCTLSEILLMLKECKKLDEISFERIYSFLQENQY